MFLSAVIMPSHFTRAKSNVKKLWTNAPKPGPATSSAPLPVPAQPAPEPTRSPPQLTPSPLATELGTLPLPSLQEKIWNQAYDELRANEPKVVDAFEKIVSAELRRDETSAESADRVTNDMTTNREARSHQMRQFVQTSLPSPRLLNGLCQVAIGQISRTVWMARSKRSSYILN